MSTLNVLSIDGLLMLLLFTMRTRLRGNNADLINLVALQESERGREQRAVAASLSACGFDDFILINCSIKSSSRTTSVRQGGTHNQDSRGYFHPQSSAESYTRGLRFSRHRLALQVRGTPGDQSNRSCVRSLRTLCATLTMRFLVGLDALFSEVDKAVLCFMNTMCSALVRDKWQVAVDAPWSWSWSWI